VLVVTSLDKSRIKVVLLEGVHDRAVENFARHGYKTVKRYKKALAGDELKDAIAGAHFVGIRSRTRLTREVIASAPKLVTIGAFCIGTNQIDLDAAMMRGIPVFNAPFSNTRSVAELVLAEITFLLRGIPAKNALLHRGVWAKSADDAREVRGKTLGIVGYGNIGTQLSVMAEALGMDVCFYDIVTKLPLGNARMMPTLDDVLAAADVVTFHVPETPLTRGMMGRDQFARMKPGAMLINASRGTVVDLDAAADALERQHLGGAAFDVFPAEPEGNDQEFLSPLRRFENVILTPHIAGSTIEAQANIVARRYISPARCQEPMKTVISATKPLRPGSPNEHKPASTNMVDTNGIIFINPPSRSTSLVCVRSYIIPMAAKKRAVITP